MTEGFVMPDIAHYDVVLRQRRDLSGFDQQVLKLVDAFFLFGRDGNDPRLLGKSGKTGCRIFFCKIRFIEYQYELFVLAQGQDFARQLGDLLVCLRLVDYP